LLYKLTRKVAVKVIVKYASFLRQHMELTQRVQLWQEWML
jgi:hypothetical protein